MHAHTAGAAAVPLHHPPVRFLVEHHPQVLEPLDDKRCIHHQRLDQFGHIGKVTAADDVQVVDGGAVVGPVGGLDATLGHHRVGVAKAQLGRHDDLGTVLLCQERRRCPRAASADDENVGLGEGLAQVKVGADARTPLDDVSQFSRHALPLAHAHTYAAHFFLDIVGVKSVEHLLTLLQRHSGHRLLEPPHTGRLDSPDGFLHFGWITAHRL